MGTKYSDQSGSASAYNSSPPPDDGSQVAANKVTWATHKTKIGDPLKAYSDAMNSLLQTTLDFSSSQQTTNYNTQLSDNMTTIEIPSGSPTISLGTAATMTKNYVVTVTNIGTGTPVIALQTNTDTLDGTVNGTLTFPTGMPFSRTFKVNNGATGYYTEKLTGQSILTNSLSGDVNLNNTATAFDGPSVAQGTKGRWFASGTVTLNLATTSVMRVRLTDGTTIIAATQLGALAANINFPISISGYIDNPAGNIKITVQDTVATTGKIVFNATGTSKDSTITVVRVA